MRISYSRYSTFNQSPERFRLSYMLGLKPEDDDHATLKNFGRRRGSCFHELQEGVPESEVVEQFGQDMVDRCNAMRLVVPQLDDVSMVEAEFELPILDGKHSIHGRIDHGFTRQGKRRIGDYKTTKGTRTKAETNEYLGDMTTSPQSHFYLYAANKLGFQTDDFTYHIIFDRKAKDKPPTYFPLDLTVRPFEVERTMRAVYAACETIEFLQNEYGIDKPWAHPNTWPCTGDKAFCGFANICGRSLAKGCAPHGFVNKFDDMEAPF